MPWEANQFDSVVSWTDANDRYCVELGLRSGRPEAFLALNDICASVFQAEMGGREHDVAGFGSHVGNRSGQSCGQIRRMY